MKKRFIFTALILILLCSIIMPFSAYASNMAMKNWQQDEPSVPGYVYGDQSGTWWYKKYDGYTFGDTGCGIMSLVNAVHYATGNFMNPLEVADWAHDVAKAYNGYDGTYREKLYPFVEAKFGSKYGFKIVNSGTYGKVSDAKFVEHIKSGGTAVVHVKGHFMAVVDYDTRTERFLLWDNCAGDGRGGHRAGATHIAGDWLTAGELEGDINKTYLTVDWYCLISSTVESSVSYSHVTTRNSLTLGFTNKILSGTIADNQTVTLGDSKGMMLTFSGWHASTYRTRQYGYSIDGGNIVYDVSFSESADQTIQNEAVKALGLSASASKFNVSVPLSDNKAHTFKIYAKDSSKETLIWTINKKADSGLTENLYYPNVPLKFTNEGTKYAIRIYQNSTSDSSFVNGWGGSDGISDKTLSKDAKLFISGAFSLKSKDCRRIGLLVDESYVVWPSNTLVKSTYNTNTICYLPLNYNLGSHGFMFDLSFDTSSLSAGSHKLKLVADCNGTLVEIGTRTATYKGGCCLFNATSSGSKYVPESTPKSTPTATPKSTPAPTSETTKKPVETISPTSSTDIDITSTPVVPVTTDEPVRTEDPLATEEVFATEDVATTEEALKTENPIITEMPSSTDEPSVSDVPSDISPMRGCGSTVYSSLLLIVLLSCVLFIRKKAD